MDFWERAHTSDRLIAIVRNSAILANPALHPLRGHPGLEGLAQAPVGRARAHRSSQFLLGWVAQALRGMSRLRSSRSLIRDALSGLDVRWGSSVLFVSHRLPGRDGFSGPDPYFGAIPAAFDSVVLLIDHRPFLTRLLSRPEAVAGRVTVPQSLGSTGELRILAQAASGTVQLARMRRSEPRGSRRDLLAEAVSRSAEAATGLRIAEFVGAACEEFQPAAIVVTYEGHPWERLAIRAARDAVPGIIALGYPPAGILPGVHALFRRLGSDLDPDGLLAPGGLAKQQIERRLPGLPVEVLGSPRRLEMPASPTSRESVCLVLPEGLVSEVERLTRFALDLASERPDVEFRLRLHPVVAGAAALRALMTRVAEAPNVHLSEASFVDDAARATWCLYRGSSAAVMAVATGIIPIYLHARGEAIIDPLSSEAADKESLQHFVVEVGEGSERLRSRHVDPDVLRVAQEYFAVLDPGAIPRLIERVRRSREQQGPATSR